MGKSLNEIATELRDNNKKVQLIYAFNGNGKTRLSKAFKSLVEPKNEDEQIKIEDKQILYYNAFTEDLFYWDNDLDNDSEHKLKLQSNAFTNWVFREQGQENNIASKFKRYTNSSLTPIVSADFTEVSFSFAHGNENVVSNVKISKGEESNYIWCIFFTVIEEIIGNIEEAYGQEPEQVNEIKYIFIDDPVTSLDDSHLIQLAVDLVALIKKSCKFNIRFVVTTHNAFFYNILLCELNNDDKSSGYKRKKHFIKYQFNKMDDGSFCLAEQTNKSPFSYHLHLKNEIEKSIKNGDLRRYHFNFLRNLYEKSATFLGYDSYIDLLPKTNDGKPDPYANRVINAYSHSKNSDEEISILSSDEREGLERIFNHLIQKHNFFKEES